MIEDAEGSIAKLPSDAVGVVFLDGGKPVQPNVNALISLARPQLRPTHAQAFARRF
jgi:hypothetical protein